jgi:hypothetical protein
MTNAAGLIRWPLPRIFALCGCALAAPAHAQFENAPSLTQPDNAFDRAVAHLIRDRAAPRTLEGAKRANERNPTAAEDLAEGLLQSGEFAAWPLLFAAPGLTIKGSLTGTLGLFSMRENGFGLPPPQVTPGYVKDPA